MTASIHLGHMSSALHQVLYEHAGRSQVDNFTKSVVAYQAVLPVYCDFCANILDNMTNKFGYDVIKVKV